MVPTVLPARVRRNSSSRGTAGQAEIGQPDLRQPVGVGDQEIRRLDVPVNDAPAVEVFEGPHRLNEQTSRFLGIELAPSADVFMEVNAVHKVERKVVDAGCFPEFLDGHQVFVTKRGTPAPLPAESVRGWRAWPGDRAARFSVPPRAGYFDRAHDRPRPFRRWQYAGAPGISRYGDTYFCRWRTSPEMAVFLTWDYAKHFLEGFPGSVPSAALLRAIPL